MAQVPLNALRAFEAVVRFGSFNAAAEALFVTQSAVSHQVRHLEDWLGSPLFDRSAGRPRLLPHGEDLARTLTLSLSEIESACRRARVDLGPKPLVIAAIPSVAVCWLIPRLSAFRNLHPEIEVRVIYAIHGHAIDFRDVHSAFVFSDEKTVQPGVTREYFLSGASVPVCSTALIETLGSRAPTADKIIAAGLLHDTDSTGWQAWLRRVGTRMPAPLVGPVFEDFNLLRAAALSGQGVALCPIAMIREDLDTGRLVQLSGIAVLNEFAYFLLSREVTDRATEAAARAFRDWAFAARGNPNPEFLNN